VYTNSSFSIVFISFVKFIVYAVDRVPVFSTENVFVISSPGCILPKFISALSVYTNSSVPVVTTWSFPSPITVELKYAYVTPRASINNTLTAIIIYSFLFFIYTSPILYSYYK